MRRPVAVLALAALLAGCSDPPAQAEGEAPSGAGALQGVVVDDALRPLPDANVTATGPSGEFSASTGGDGLFRFDGLAPGVYLVRVSKAFYTPSEQAVDVREGEADPAPVKVQLLFVPASVPFADLYKFEGLFECSAWPTNGCANVNILTGIVFCSLGIPCFNVTGDRSVELIPVVPQPGFLQSEMVWTPTNDQGRSMLFGLGAATREELQDGFADGYNDTQGESPLVVTLQDEVLKESRIGIDGRQLLIQVSVGVTTPLPVCPPGLGPPCGLGVSAEQPYTTFTTAFFGYRPPVGWRFTETGQAPPPPS